MRDGLRHIDWNVFGTCPRKFFFRHGLQIAPPSEFEFDSDQWLDPLMMGSLLHEVFEAFLREITKENRFPEIAQDHARVQEILHDQVDRYRATYPVPNEDAYRRQLEQLEKTCEIFLHQEEAYCRENDAFPWIPEASIGLETEPESELDIAEPVRLKLSDGRSFTTGGRIDRIDRVGGKEATQFAIWDYKTGSAYGFDQDNPFKQGRKLQSFLYVGMLRHRLHSTIGKHAKVSMFGYFFPSPKMNGLRLQWTPESLTTGDEILKYIFDAIANGTFLATTEPSDCGFCEFQSICRDIKQEAAQAKELLQFCSKRKLSPLRKLREIELERK